MVPKITEEKGFESRLLALKASCAARRSTLQGQGCMNPQSSMEQQQNWGRKEGTIPAAIHIIPRPTQPLAVHPWPRKRTQNTRPGHFPRNRASQDVVVCLLVRLDPHGILQGSRSRIESVCPVDTGEEGSEMRGREGREPKLKGNLRSLFLPLKMPNAF